MSRREGERESARERKSESQRARESLNRPHLATVLSSREKETDTDKWTDLLFLLLVLFFHKTCYVALRDSVLLFVCSYLLGFNSDLKHKG